MSKSAVAELTGKLPFAGKHAVKWMFEQGREASRHDRKGRKMASAVGLAIFADLHARNLDNGIHELIHHSDKNAAEVVIDAAYTIANAMVAYTQAYLTLKVLGTRSEVVTAITPEGAPVVSKPPDKEIAPPRVIPSATELAVTLGGQIMFLATRQ